MAEKKRPLTQEDLYRFAVKASAGGHVWHVSINFAALDLILAPLAVAQSTLIAECLKRSEWTYAAFMGTDSARLLDKVPGHSEPRKALREAARSEKTATADELLAWTKKLADQAFVLKVSAIPGLETLGEEDILIIARAMLKRHANLDLFPPRPLVRIKSL